MRIKRTFKCLKCKNYDIEKGGSIGSINRICNKLKNDPRIIVNLDAPNCNDFIVLNENERV